MLTEQQLKIRKNSIGGSDSAIILGLSNYKTPYELYLEKTGDVEPSLEYTDAQYWGSTLEPIVRDEFAKRHECKIETPDIIYHPMYSFMHANVDGVIKTEGADEVLEIKCANSFAGKVWGEPGSDFIPPSYLIQVAHYCSVLNLDVARIAVLIGGYDYREYTYNRDMSLENRIIEACSDFWKCVQRKTPPTLTTPNDARLMYKDHQEEKSIVAGYESLGAVEALRQLKSSNKEAKAKEDELKLIIMKSMEDAEMLLDAEERCIATWKTNKRGARTLLLKNIED